MGRIVRKGFGILAITALIGWITACGGGGGGGGSDTEGLAWIGPWEYSSWDTDGTWAVWAGREPAAIWYDGPTGPVEISALLEPDKVLVPYWFDFDGRFLAFTAIGRSMAHIYYYDTVSGDLVHAASTRMLDIYMTNPQRSIWAGSSLPVQPTYRRGPGDQAEPRVHEGVIAWHVKDENYFEDEEIWVFDIATGIKSQLTDNFENDHLVNVDVGTVVLERFPTTGGDADIFSVDLSSGVETRLTDNDKVERFISFEEGSIVWSDDSAIYGLELASAGNSPSIIKSAGVLTVDDLWLDQDLLVWRESDLTVNEIWYADLSSGVHSALPLKVSGDSFPVLSTPPRVGGGVIAWTNDADGDQEIYAWDTNAALPTVVKVTDNNYSDTDFEVGDGVIWWKADYDGAGEKLLSYDVRAARYSTKVSGDHQEVPGVFPPVVWSQVSSDLQVWARRLDGGAAVAISPANLDLGSHVVVQGQVAAWTALDGSDREIYYCDLSASTSTVIQVTDNVWLDDDIHLEEGILTWKSHDGSDGEIFAYELNAPIPTLIQVTDNDWEDDHPRLKNGLLVWEGDPDATELEIFYYDLNAPAPSVVRLTDNTVFDGVPRTDGTLIVWAGENPLDSNLEIFSFDSSAGSTSIFQVTDDPYEDRAPVVDAGIIAWEKSVTNLRGEIMSHIYVFDTTVVDPAQTMLYLDGFDSNESLRGELGLEGGVLAWTAFQWDLDGNEVLGADLNTGTEVFRLSNNETMDWWPRLAERAVIWRQDYWLNIHLF
jgi:hypothetical protein